MALRTTHQRLLVFAAGGGCCGCSCWRFVATLCSRTSLSSSSGGACCHAGVRRISSMMELLSTNFQPFLMSLQSGTSFRFPTERDRFGVCRPLGGGFSLHSLSKDSSFSASSLALKLKPKTGRRGVLELSRAVSAAAAVTARSPETDLFLADPSITWKSLGLSQELTKALLQIDLQQPSLIQAASIPLILSTGDVIVAAETGSGKTHAYLVPLIHKLLQSQKAANEAEKLRPGEYARRSHHFALILCPNATLCQQVADMANALASSAGEPLLQVAVICGGQGWPISPPDMVIATPAALINNLFAFDPRRRRRSAFIRDVRFVVLDEADMLLGGAFIRQVGRLIDMFRLEEKQLSRDWELEKVQGIGSTKEFQPWTDFQPTEDAEVDTGSSDSEEEEVSNWSDPVDDEPITSEESSELPQSSGRQAEMERRGDWLKARKAYKRSKQYVFVAATLPQAGKRTPGAVLRQKFPEASWVNGHLLHCHNPRLEHQWVEVTEDSRIPALLEAVGMKGTLLESDPTISHRTMVFANSVESVDGIWRVLERAGVKSKRYHRDLPLDERAESLQVFEQDGGLLICTDSAARGLDIPNIGHVIQAEFASSAVEFLHRVGRTARAGRPGKVTSLFTDSNHHLVNAVREAVTTASPVEGAFSRKRSFRRKIKKYGAHQGLLKP
ncbi:hypothetical protein CY35_12G021000 [Sphagnum magellanicum]|nr:hypothetical protein CY35_12G021000 [Sphagnum magellanicum]